MPSDSDSDTSPKAWLGPSGAISDSETLHRPSNGFRSNAVVPEHVSSFPDVDIAPVPELQLMAEGAKGKNRQGAQHSNQPEDAADKEASRF